MMIPVEYEEGKKIVETCTCECGGALTLAWGGDWGINSHVLKCTRDINHNRIARPAILGPYDIPGFNLFNLKRRQQEVVEELGEQKATKLKKYEAVVSLTRAQAMEILKTIWPGAPGVEVLKAAIICHQYGLNPLMKHLFLIPFKRKEKGVVVGEDWVVVLSIKTHRLLAHRRHHYSYLDLTPRRMTTEEQEGILGEFDDSRIWAITKIKDVDTGAEAMGIGSWPKDEVPYGTEKGNTKLNMASIRSERQALDRQYPGEMPEGVEVIDEEYVPIKAGESLISPDGGGEKDVPKAGGGDIKSTAVSPPPKAKEPTARGAPPAAQPAPEKIEGEGFSIDLTFLKESLKAIKWTDDTTKTFLVSKYKVSPEGTLAQVIQRLGREQAEEFIKELSERVTNKAENPRMI